MPGPERGDPGPGGPGRARAAAPLSGGGWSRGGGGGGGRWQGLAGLRAGGGPGPLTWGLQVMIARRGAGERPQEPRAPYFREHLYF